MINDINNSRGNQVCGAGEAFDLTAQRLLDKSLWVDESLWVGADASDEIQKKKRCYSLRKSLVEGVIEGARRHSIECDLDNSEFERLALEGISVIDDLQVALLKTSTHTPSDWNFWQHEENPVQLMLQHKVPCMSRDTIERCTTRYLNLPYRAPLLERLLVDVLVALEMYAYGDLVFAPIIVRWLMPRKARNRKLMAMMIQAYSELASNAALSTKRIREVVSKAADSGVVWPHSLWSILDDNIGRIGRL